MSEQRPGGSVEWESFDGEEPVETGQPQSTPGAEELARVRSARFVSLDDEPEGTTAQSIELLRDVEVELTAELGSARMLIKHILGLRPGSVVELNRLAGEPIDIMVNKTLIARGEVVVVDEKFAIRVVEIVPPDRRLAGS